LSDRAGEGDRDDPPGAGAAHRRDQGQPHSRPAQRTGGIGDAAQTQIVQRPSCRSVLRNQPGAALAHGAPHQIKKSSWLAALHAEQWWGLSARFAARRRAACAEPDEAKRDGLLAEIERQEAMERAALADSQQAETAADLAAQVLQRARAAAANIPPRMPWS
jgi:hypothetical protein